MNRTRAAIFVAIIALWSAPIRAADFALPDDIERLLALPEDRIDVGEAALIFAREVFPDLVDVIANSREIDRLADETRAIMPPHASTDEALFALGKVIYEREGYHYDFGGTTPEKDSLNPDDKAEDYYLPAILQLKHGTCVTLPMLFYAVAQRLGMPVAMASAPQHTLIHVTDPTARIQNWEATDGGPSRNVWIIQQNNVPAAAIKSGTYMRAWSKREFLAELLEINGHFYQHTHDYATAIQYYERAVQINPTFDAALVGLQAAYLNRLFRRISTSYYPGDNTADLVKAQYYGDRVAALGAADVAYDDLNPPEGDHRHDEFLRADAN